MISERQLIANRTNARYSTGPTSRSGKEVVSRNATKHGLLSERTLIDTEDREELEAFRDGLQASLAPEGEIEELLCDRIVSASWRLRRLIKIEALFLESGEKDICGGSLQACFEGRRRDGMATLSRYEIAIERSLYKALHELQRLQANRQTDAQIIPVAVDVEVSGIKNGFVS